MEYFKKIRPAIEKRNIVVPPSHREEEKSIGIDTSDNTEEEIFGDFDSEKAKVKEWWLQEGEEEVVEEHGDVEEVVEEHEEVEAAVEEEHKEEGWGEETEEESKEDKDDFISSLREEDEEDEMDMVLKEAMEEMGDVSAEELLELGRAALRGMAEGGK
ncbi:MAG: hypothetical protein IBX41_06640 [Methanophagales archaeon]|nr:hypothetical protein [Methanophagales archaeon]